ncbi:hypothetical protein CTI12_AA388900 [Artemisia annua]|uniref:CHCH domain-containing protein n=1 Tax=Artemisia annua TaxID=35608 RepID=A0A2U1MD10_ARTAN|nr:hypothetical protein CTI12_AA388900 [Artemisia annua]
MGRRSSGGRSSYRRSAPKAAPKTSKSTTPAPASSASSVPMKSEPSGGLVANMVATVADGFIWSTGNAMAHRAMDAIMGPRTVQIENVPAAAPAAQVASSAAPADACASQNKAFYDCINTSGSDISKCQFYMDMLSQCRKSGSATPVAVSF